MNVISITIGGHKYNVEYVSDAESIRIGMRKYRTPPPYGMLFPLRGMYSAVTMEGMLFPLDVSFYDIEGNVMPHNGVYWRRIHPGDSNIPIPVGAYYMIEFPTSLVA